MEKNFEETLKMCQELYEMRKAVKPWWEYSLEAIEKGFVPKGSGR